MDANRLADVLSYDPLTGEFRWLVDRGRTARAGSLAGSIHTDRHGSQYRIVWVFGKPQKAHRLAWLFTHGRWPVDQIDHIDGDGLNNRIANLREANNAQNQHNKSANSNSKSGVKGVCWHQEHKKWRANIRQDGRYRHLGYFDTVEEAKAAYDAAAELCHGEFRKVS